MHGTSLTKFTKDDPHAKDQPRHPAGESALDPEIRIAHQVACQARIDARQQPVIKGMRVTAQENHYRQIKGTGKRAQVTSIPYRVFEGVGEVKSIEDGLARVMVDGRLIIARVGQLIAAPPEPVKVLDDLLYDRPALPNGKIGALLYNQPALLMLPAPCLKIQLGAWILGQRRDTYRLYENYYETFTDWRGYMYTVHRPCQPFPAPPRYTHSLPNDFCPHCAGEGSLYIGWSLEQQRGRDFMVCKHCEGTGKGR